MFGKPCNVFDPVTVPDAFAPLAKYEVLILITIIVVASNSWWLLCRFPVKNVNDRLVCGLPVFDSAENNYTFLMYEWFGFCGEVTACLLLLQQLLFLDYCCYYF